MKRFTSLADHKFRVLGLVISGIAIVLLAILHLLDYEYQDGWYDRIFIMNHFIIVFGLYIIMYSKEKYDDERVNLSIYIILYIIEAVLILYQLLFRYCLARNPSWIFKETTRNKFRFYYLSFSLFFLIGWIIYVVIHYKF